MPTIFISDSGDDSNDGFSIKTPVYSLQRAEKLQAGRNDSSWHFGPRAWQRIKNELTSHDGTPSGRHSTNEEVERGGSTPEN